MNNIIFDLGNVLFLFNNDNLTSAVGVEGDDLRLISDVLFDRLYWDRLDDGSITDEEVKEAVCKRLPERLHEKACLVFDSWIKNMPPVEGMYELICDLKKVGKKIYLISNISDGFAKTWQSYPHIEKTLSLFDGLVLSGAIKLAKPHKKIFEYLLDKFSLDPSDCIFIDDAIRNIEGAASAGIEGYLFDGDVNALRKTLIP